MVNPPWAISAVRITATRHFGWKYLARWGWSEHDLRDAIANAYRIDKVGKNKYETYVMKRGPKKIVLAYEEGTILCITGSEGGHRV